MFLILINSSYSRIVSMYYCHFLSCFRIDANVEETDTNVEAAHGELLKYFQNISSNRWLIIKIFFTLIIFFIVFVVFMA